MADREPRSAVPSPSDTPATVPILMLNYGGWDDTLAGLAAMPGDRAATWLIDNASPQGRMAEIAAAYPEVRRIAMDRNWGWAGAYNRAIATAAAEGHRAVYVLNNEAVPHPGAVAAAVETLFSDERIGAVGSVMLDDEGARTYFDGTWYTGDAGPLAADTHREVRAVRQFHGGGFALKLAAYDAVGAFHEPYFLYHEETDWCLRARAGGWTIVVDGRSRVNHAGGASNAGYNSSYYMARNRFLARTRGIELRDRAETRLSIVEYEMLEGHDAPLAQRIAIVDGLLDGLRGRFGQRTATWPRGLVVPLATLLPGAFRLKRKAGHLLSRLRPGASG